MSSTRKMTGGWSWKSPLWILSADFLLSSNGFFYNIICFVVGVKVLKKGLICPEGNATDVAE